MVSILQELQIPSIDNLKNEKFIKEKLDGRNPQLISKMLLMMYSMDREIKELTARIDRYENSGSMPDVERSSNEVKVNGIHVNVNDGDHSNANDTANDYGTNNDNESGNYTDNDTDEYIDNGADIGTHNSNDINEDADKNKVGEIWNVGKDSANDIKHNGKDIVNDISRDINDMNDISRDTNKGVGKGSNSDMSNDIGNIIGTDIDGDIVNDANSDIANNTENDIGKNSNNDIDNNINININIGSDKDNISNTNKLKTSNDKHTYIFNDDENKIVKRSSWPTGPHGFKTPLSFSENFCSTMNENIKKNGRPWPEISLNQLAIKFKIPKDILARNSRNLNVRFQKYNKLKTNHYNITNSKSEALKQSKQIENKRNKKKKLSVIPKIENKNSIEVKSNRNPIKKRPKKLRITRSRVQRNRSGTDDVESSSESVSDPNAPSSSEDDDDKNDDIEKFPPYTNDNVELKGTETHPKNTEPCTEQPTATSRNPAKRIVEINDEEKPIKIIKKPKNCKIKEETRSNNLKTHSHLSMAELLNHSILKSENLDSSNDAVSDNKTIDENHKIGPACISQTHILSDQLKIPDSLDNQPEFKYTVTEKGFFKCDTCVADPQIFLQYIDLYRHKQLQHPEEFPKYVIH